MIAVKYSIPDLAAICISKLAKKLGSTFRECYSHVEGSSTEPFLAEAARLFQLAKNINMPDFQLANTCPILQISSKDMPDLKTACEDELFTLLDGPDVGAQWAVAFLRIAFVHDCPRLKEKFEFEFRL